MAGVLQSLCGALCAGARLLAGNSRPSARGRGAGQRQAVCGALILAAACVAQAPPAAAQPVACLAEGTPAEVVAEYLMAAARAGPLAANVDDIWSTTATDGSGLVRGEPITLTWSIVPDGTTIDPAPGITGESSDPSDLIAFLDSEYGSSATWLPLIQNALDGWSNGPGIVFAYEPFDDGAELNEFAGVVGIRGDIRIGGHSIDGDASVLGYAYFPTQGGDIVIDTADSLNGTALRFQNLIAHEAGHAIGLGHTCPRDRTKLMEPVIVTTFAGPQFDDLLGAHRNYGDSEEENDFVGEAADIGLAINTVTSATGLALDGTNDDDWFEIPAGSLTQVTIQLDPAGTPYEFEAITGGTCPGGSSPVFDPRDIQNLSVAVYDFDGTTVIDSSDTTAVGGSEFVDAARVSRFGGFIEVTQSGGVNDAQGYEIEITLVPEPGRTALQLASFAAIGWLGRGRMRASRLAR